MKKRLVIFVVVMAVLLPLLAQLQKDGSDLHWYSLVPPVLAVGLAFATHNIFLSLGISVLLGGPLTQWAQNPPLTATVDGIGFSLKQAYGSLTDPINLQILAFACFVLIMIGVIQDAGGFRALALRLARYAKGKKSTKFMTFLLGLAVFIDDYASTMIVGSSMRPLSDRNGISREKLAFLVDATSAPIAGLAVISTWIGYEVGLFEEVSKSLSLGQNGYSMFFDAISFRFYCMFMLFFIVVNIATGIDFGPMKKAEARAVPIVNTDDDESARIDAGLSKTHIWIAIVPFVALMVYLLVSLWFDGKGPQVLAEGGSLWTMTYWRTVVSQASNNILILAKSSVLGLFLAILLSFAIAKTHATKLGAALFDGMKKSMIPIVILVLAWSLKSICTELKTGPFLAQVLADVLQPAFFPAVLFIVSSLIAISTGTSWGTMAILIPTAIPVAYHLDGNMYGIITMISLGAILDGAIMGDHCSPISDTTILSSMSSGCDLMAHVQTQMPYSVLIATAALIFGYLPAGYGWSPAWSLLMASIAILTLFAVLKYRQRQSQ